MDNSFAVPYNPLLSLWYKAHINVEVVYSVQAVKYLHKFITKGQDRIKWRTTYMNALYISASEAVWKIRIWFPHP